MSYNRLKEPNNININFRPSEKQYELWQSLQPDLCPICGGHIIEKPIGVDKQGHTMYEPSCEKCGNENIPELILAGGSAGGGKSYLLSCWLISSCMRFPDIRAVVARKTLKSLKESTWNTIRMVMRDWGLIEGENFKINNLEGSITFWNNSMIIAKELAFQPADPRYERLGSSEFTIAGVDEASEISEMAINVLRSRLRWKTHETFKVGKLLLTTNPCMNWIRSRFVQDENGDPVKCRKNEAYIPFSVFDNPDVQFRNTYRAALEQIPDKATRDRLLYGNWDFVETNDLAAYWNFNGDKHLVEGLREKVYDPTKPLILSFDFNVVPYMSCLVSQIDYDEKKIYVIEEILGKPKNRTNNTPALSRMIKEKYLRMRHSGGIIVTGDPSGKARSTQTEDGTNNFTIILDNLRDNMLRPKLRLFTRQPSQIRRLEFVNEMLNNYEGWDVQIDIRCRKFTEDLVYQKKNEDGTKCKAKVADPDNAGSKYEKYGHLSDCFDYTLCYFVHNAWSDFQSSKEQIATTASIVYNEYEF